MKQPIIALFIASIFLISFSISVSAETIVYDDFSGDEMDLGKWHIKCGFSIYPCPDEYYLDTSEEVYHIAQLGSGESRLILTMTNYSFSDEKLEYDVNYVSGSGNRMQHTYIDEKSLESYMQEQYGCSYCGGIGYWNNPMSIGNDFGIYHYEISFTETGIDVAVTRPDSSVWTTTVDIDQTSLEPPYEIGVMSATGHNGIMHFDYDNVVITTEEPSGEYEVDNNTVALWHLNEGEGDTAFDETGVNHGTINGAIWDMNCFYGKCLNFDGEDDHVIVPDGDSLDLTTEGTLEAWIKTPGGEYGGIVGKATNYFGDTFAYSFQQNTAVHGGRLMLVFSSGGSGHCQEIIGNTPITDNQWHHVAATWNGTVINIYIDGDLDASVPQTCSPWVTNFPLHIGNLGGANTPQDTFLGKIDEVRISNIARDFEIDEEEPSDLEERVAALEERVTVLEGMMVAVQDGLDALSGAFYDFVDMIISFLSHQPNGIKKQMICGYMEDEGLTEYSALGLNCEINNNGNCFC
ncbi:MAG: LamG domain-containing protein [Nanoarchaeota archaeon]